MIGKLDLTLAKLITIALEMDRPDNQEGSLMNNFWTSVVEFIAYGKRKRMGSTCITSSGTWHLSTRC
ncbi:hypothetical protein GBA52_003467 [Prunus armeniaca]|nr:hypothetical protein GBA52_003467 [Prunus armeniaca]